MEGHKVDVSVSWPSHDISKNLLNLTWLRWRCLDFWAERKTRFSGKWRTTTFQMQTSWSGFSFMGRSELESPASSTRCKVPYVAESTDKLWSRTTLLKVTPDRYEECSVISLYKQSSVHFTGGFLSTGGNVSPVWPASRFLNVVTAETEAMNPRWRLKCDGWLLVYDSQYTTYKIPRGINGFYPFAFADTMGMERTQGIQINDIKLALTGQIPEGYKVKLLLGFYATDGRVSPFNATVTQVRFFSSSMLILLRATWESRLKMITCTCCFVFIPLTIWMSWINMWRRFKRSEPKPPNWVNICFTYHNVNSSSIRLGQTAPVLVLSCRDSPGSRPHQGRHGLSRSPTQLTQHLQGLVHEGQGGFWASFELHLSFSCSFFGDVPSSSWQAGELWHDNASPCGSGLSSACSVHGSVVLWRR